MLGVCRDCWFLELRSIPRQIPCPPSSSSSPTPISVVSGSSSSSSGTTTIAARAWPIPVSVLEHVSSIHLDLRLGLNNLNKRSLISIEHRPTYSCFTEGSGSGVAAHCYHPAHPDVLAPPLDMLQPRVRVGNTTVAVKFVDWKEEGTHGVCRTRGFIRQPWWTMQPSICLSGLDRLQPNFRLPSNLCARSSRPLLEWNTRWTSLRWLRCSRLNRRSAVTIAGGKIT
ncbi:hypothetical protein PVAP13_3NG213952 [Panicum virgatum]|uniref:Uncharacterized protein n=1 Tax=Panicum virgatum TaxID=38727 RepID=A0A8T0UJ56_PANVG|nr:hypothetical protein PVAP13_3NG213952 [Panicum virgatum]